MGTTYYVGCKDCGVKRDLDKFYALIVPHESREAVLELASRIRDADAFRAAMLVAFMGAHRGHNCTVFSEHDELQESLPDESVDLWSPAPTEGEKATPSPNP